MNKLVSIIINCHNGEKYLSQCIESVLNQEYQNWEIIFWDNCSSDKSKDIFLKYMKKDKRLNYFYSDKLTNLSLARNFAISRTSGQLICFLDTDDYWSSDKIKKQIEFIVKKNASLVFCNFEIEHDHNKKKEISFNNELKKKTDLTDLLLKKYIVGLSTIMFNKTKVKVPMFNDKYHIIGDFDFVMKNSLNKDIFGINDVLVKIKRHQNNETIKKFKLYTLELLYWSKKNKEYFEEYKNFDKFRKSIFYEIAKLNLCEKKYKRFTFFFRKTDIIRKFKIIFYYFSKMFKTKS